MPGGGPGVRAGGSGQTSTSCERSRRFAGGREGRPRRGPRPGRGGSRSDAVGSPRVRRHGGSAERPCRSCFEAAAPLTLGDGDVGEVDPGLAVADLVGADLPAGLPLPDDGPHGCGPGARPARSGATPRRSGRPCSRSCRLEGLRARPARPVYPVYAVYTVTGEGERTHLRPPSRGGRVPDFLRTRGARSGVRRGVLACRVRSCRSGWCRAAR